MITNKINQAIQFIQGLNPKKFRQYLLTTLAATSILALSIIYGIYYASSSLIDEMRQLNSLENKIEELVAKNNQIIKEEQNSNDLLKANPNFTINSYFERFCSKHNLKPEANWKAEEGEIVQGSEEGTGFQEIKLKAMFKNQTMQKLVGILSDVIKEPIVYVKALDIFAEQKTINFEITLATKQHYRKEREE